MFWTTVDWFSGVRGKVERSRKQSIERRRETTAVKTEPAEVVPVPAKPKLAVNVQKIKLKAPKLRRAKPEPKQYPCPSCGVNNTPPIVFCNACHAPYLQVSKFAILSLVTLAVSCFFTAEYFGREADWPFPWPIYIFYSVVFLVVNSVLLRKAGGVSFVAFCWAMAFLAGGSVIAFVGAKEATGTVADAVKVFSQFAEENPIAQIIVASGAGLALIILLVWMARQYTFSHAYRIVILMLAAGAYAMKYLYPVLTRSPQIEAAFWFMPDEDSSIQGFELAAINLLRVLIAEMIVFSLVKSYKPAMQAFEKRRIRAKAKKTQAAGIDQGIESVYSLSILIANTFTRFYLQIEHGVIGLFQLAREFADRLGQFLWLLLRDLMFPVAALSGAVWAILAISAATAQYIELRALNALGLALLATFALYACQMIFLAAKTRIDFRRLLGAEILLFLWFGPYMLLLFIFVSMSLFAVGLVLMRMDESLNYPFRVGPITLGALAVTALLLVVAVVRRHRAGESEEEVEDALPVESDEA